VQRLRKNRRVRFPGVFFPRKVELDPVHEPARPKPPDGLVADFFPMAV
jgi:hypothetical protein